MTKRRFRVGVLGATGSVGQKLVRLLDGHPWFELAAVTASERSMGRRYTNAVHWLEPTPPPESAADLVVGATEPESVAGVDCDLVFSALDSGVARRVEPAFARAGYPVVSNAGALRMDPRVPLLVPEINPDHLGLVSRQEYGDGFVVTNPNCATIGLVLALKPLADCFGIDTVQLTTLQAISGAGYPGVSGLDILGNVIPQINNEEEKLLEEPGKILGRLGSSGVEPDQIVISAQVTRVPVIDGHTLSISVKLRCPTELADVREAFAAFRSPIAGADLPSAPQKPLVLMGEGPYPQPRLHAELGGGMVVCIGRLRPCPVADYRFVALVHNTIRGAAGAAILNAELLVHKGLIPS